METKLKSISELAEIVAAAKAAGKKVVLCHGVFDLLHPGHHRHLKAAKSLGDILVVTVTADKYINRGPGRPVFSQELRAESIADLQAVDFVAINDDATAVELIKRIKPDIYVKGSDYANPEADITGEITREKEAVTSVSGQMHFTDDVSFSSTELINRYLSPYPEEARAFLAGFRQKYQAGDVIKKLKALEGLRVLVVGDTIIDEYCYCNALGKTAKDNIIAVKYTHEETFAGGVLAAANHIAGFCQTVDLVTCLGKSNGYEQFILTHLKPNIKVKFFYHEAPTIVKRRFIDRAFMSKMFEVAYMNESLPALLRATIANYLARCVPAYDVVLVTDFGHGLIDRQTAGVLSRARFLAVNTQTNSANAGFNFITKYTRADYICLDEPEIRLACVDKYSAVEALVKQLAATLGCTKMALTRGHRGSLTYGDGQVFHIPVLSDRVIDRMGAGDAYLAVTSPCVAAGLPMDLVGFIGNAVGALKVQIIGNKESIEPVPLFKFITALLK